MQKEKTLPEMTLKEKGIQAVKELLTQFIHDNNLPIAPSNIDSLINQSRSGWILETRLNQQQEPYKQPLQFVLSNSTIYAIAGHEVFQKYIQDQISFEEFKNTLNPILEKGLNRQFQANPKAELFISNHFKKVLSLDQIQELNQKGFLPQVIDVPSIKNPAEKIKLFFRVNPDVKVLEVIPANKIRLPDSYKKYNFTEEDKQKFSEGKPVLFFYKNNKNEDVKAHIRYSVPLNKVLIENLDQQGNTYTREVKPQDKFQQNHKYLKAIFNDNSYIVLQIPQFSEKNPLPIGVSYEKILKPFSDFINSDLTKLHLISEESYKLENPQTRFIYYQNKNLDKNPIVMNEVQFFGRRNQSEIDALTKKVKANPATPKQKNQQKLESKEKSMGKRF